MSTVQEIFTTIPFNKVSPPLNRLKQLTFSDGSVVVSSVTYGDNGGKCTSNSIIAPWLRGSSDTPVTARGEDSIRQVLTYNLDKKLIVITDCSPIDASTDASSYAPNIILIKSTTGVIWNDYGSIRYASISDIVTRCGTIFSCLNMNNVQTLTRKDASGYISLKSNFGWYYPDNSGHGASVPSNTLVRLSGTGVYLADGDISDMCSDYGKIIADGDGKSYICCGRRLWMDYD